MPVDDPLSRTEIEQIADMKLILPAVFAHFAGNSFAEHRLECHLVVIRSRAAAAAGRPIRKSTGHRETAPCRAPSRRSSGSSRPRTCTNRRLPAPDEPTCSIASRALSAAAEAASVAVDFVTLATGALVAIGWFTTRYTSRLASGRFFLSRSTPRCKGRRPNRCSRDC